MKRTVKNFLSIALIMGMMMLTAQQSHAQETPKQAAANLATHIGGENLSGTGRLSATASGANVYVSGSVTGAIRHLHFVLPTGVTVY